MNEHLKRALRNGLSLEVSETELGFMAEVYYGNRLVGISIQDSKEEAAEAALNEAMEDETWRSITRKMQNKIGS